MKFYAILKDSLRETLDSKVLYVLLVLSGLVILGVASISYQPKPADKGIEAILARFAGAQARVRPFAEPTPPPLRYELQDFKQTNEKKPWDGDYQFIIVVHEQATQMKEGKEEPVPDVFRTVVWLGLLRMDESKLTPEDRQARERLLAMQEQVQNMPRDQWDKFLNEKMKQEIQQVTTTQMERFIEDQLRSHGTLQVKNVTYEPTDNKDFRFAVQASSRNETFRTWPHSTSYLFGAYTSHDDTPIGNLVFGIEGSLIGSTGAGIAMLVASIITSFYIPNMLRKGTVDLLIAKPIHRSALLAYKYVGGLLFMFINTVVIVLGVWLVVGLRSGLWGTGFLLSIFVLTFQFAIFYAVSTVFAVLTRSPIVCIMMACVTWVILWAVGTGYIVVDATRELKLLWDWIYPTVDTIHFILPRYKDLDALNAQLIGADLLGPESPERKAMEKVYSSINWGQTIGVTLAFIAGCLGFSCWWFSRRDY